VFCNRTYLKPFITLCTSVLLTGCNEYSYLQDYCLSHLEELLNERVFQAETEVIGHAIVELGRAETYLLRCARCQTRKLQV